MPSESPPAAPPREPADPNDPESPPGYFTVGPFRPTGAMSAPPPLPAPPSEPGFVATTPEPATPPPPPPAAGPPPPPPGPPPEPRRPPLTAVGDFVRRIDPRVAAVVLAILVIGGGLIALGTIGRSAKPHTTAQATTLDPTSTPESTKTPRPKPTPKPGPSLKSQILKLDTLLKLSQKGRAAAVQGNFKAATANRAELLKDLQSLQGKAKNTQLKAGLAAFIAAITESLRQNRTCGSKCPSSDIAKVSTLKATAVVKLNPLLHRFGAGPYSSKTI